MYESQRGGTLDVKSMVEQSKVSHGPSVAYALQGMREAAERLHGLENRLDDLCIALDGGQPTDGDVRTAASVNGGPDGRPLLHRAMDAVSGVHDVISRIEQIERRIKESLGV